jgi:hypothetical protein
VKLYAEYVMLGLCTHCIVVHSTETTLVSLQAARLALPQTHFLLDYVRPDLMMLRVIARALILWSSVAPTNDWVLAQLPTVRYTHTVLTLLTAVSQLLLRCQLEKRLYTAVSCCAQMTT